MGLSLATFQLVGCGDVTTNFQSSRSTLNTNVLSGVVSEIANGTAGNSSLSTCTSPTASLYSFDSTGLSTTALATTSVASNGEYSFSNIASSGVTAAGKYLNGQYAVVVTGCTRTYTRLLTGFSSQTVDLGSTLISYALNNSGSLNLSSFSQKTADELMQSLSSSTSFSTAYSTLAGNAALSQKFQTLFGAAPTMLADATPLSQSLSIPTSIAEVSTTSFTASMQHWDSSYNVAYEWSLDGSQISTTSAASYTPTANSQGNRTLTLKWGRQNGGGTLDLTKPYQTKTYTIQVQNSVLPTAPSFTLGPASTVVSPSLTLTLSTGAALVNCASFSKLAITEDSMVAPLLDSAYTITCSSGPTQNVSYTLQGGDGAHTLYLWAKDASGQISATATSVSVTKATANPLAFSSPAANTTAQNGLTITGTCDLTRPISISGSGVLSSASISCNNGNFSQLIYFSAGDGTKTITLSQTDYFSVTSTVSRNFIRDSTNPTLTQTTVTSPYRNKNNTATFGGACEAGLTIQVSGTDTGTASCGAGTWTYTTQAQTTDNSRDYTFTQTDAAGNTSSVTSTWVRDTVAPALTFTSSSAFVTSTSSVVFAGNCESAGSSISVTGSATATVACTGGTWSYTASAATDATRNYTFTQTDTATNSTSLSGSWNRITSGATLTITQSSPQLTATSTLVISGTCTGGPAGSSGTIQITGSVTTTTTCSSTTTSAGTWSYTASQGSDGTANYTFTLVDNLANSTSASLTWVRDTLPPVATNSSFTVNGGTNTSTYNSYVPIAFSATDLSKVSFFCLKTSNSAPSGSDSCWYPVNGSQTNVTPASSVTVTGYKLYLGITPQLYDVYLWLKDDSGWISTNTATSGKDYAQVTLQTLTAPSLSSVLVGNSDTMTNASSERSISAASDVYIRWTASGTSLGATPVSLFFSTDDVTWTSFATGLANGVNNCSSITGSGSASTGATGCYKWTNGSPTSSYYRIRVSITDSNSATTIANSLALNSGNFLLLAGNTESGVTGSAASAVFVNDYTSIYTGTDQQSLVVGNDGSIYFRSTTDGILKIDPLTKKVTQVIATGATTSGSGDGGPARLAKLRAPVMMALDYQGRLLVMDYDRIRRIDLTQTDPTISTIVGGGADSASATVNGALNLSISPYSTTPYTNTHTQMTVLPNGNIYFFDRNYDWNITKNIRLYDATADKVYSIVLSGPASTFNYNDGSAFTVASVTHANCRTGRFDIAFDPATSQIQYMSVGQLGYAGCTSTGTRGFYFKIDPTTGEAMQTQAFEASWTGLGYTPIQALDGQIYRSRPNIIKKYNYGSDTWTTVLGTGLQGSCADDTNATSCNVNPGSAFVDANGRLFFSERGRIRAVVGGKVVTLYGQSYSYGDSGPAINARFGNLTGVEKRSNGDYVALDYSTGRFRNFTPNGNVTTIAGNDVTLQTPNTSSLPTTQAVWTIARNFHLDVTNDFIYYGMPSKIMKLNAAGGSPWSNVSGSPTDYYLADGANFNTVQFTATPAIVGSTSNSFSFLVSRTVSGNWNDGVLGEVNISTGIYKHVTHPQGAGGNGDYCAAGTDLTTCGFTSIGNAASNLASQKHSFDSVTGNWIVIAANGTSVRGIPAAGTGTVSAVTTLANPSIAFTMIRSGGSRYVYYCNQSNGKVYIRNVETSTEAALVNNLPTNYKCEGRSLSYDAASKTLTVIVTQNGLSGVAQLLNADPTTNGL